MGNREGSSPSTFTWGYAWNWHTGWSQKPLRKHPGSNPGSPTYLPVTQSVEYLTFNQRVVSSNLAWKTHGAMAELAYAVNSNLTPIGGSNPSRTIGRYGGIGRQKGLKILCLRGVWVRSPLPAPKQFVRRLQAMGRGVAFSAGQTVISLHHRILFMCHWCRGEHSCLPSRRRGFDSRMALSLVGNRPAPLSNESGGDVTASLPL